VKFENHDAEAKDKKPSACGVSVSKLEMRTESVFINPDEV
jgi:hypothetical protein